jgi:hypothetical protein
VETVVNAQLEAIMSGEFPLLGAFFDVRVRSILLSCRVVLCVLLLLMIPLSHLFSFFYFY